MAMNIPATTDADKAYAMKAAEFRSMPNDQQGMARLQQATRGPFGALALIEIDKRTRAELLDAVQKQNLNQQGNMLQQALQRQAQAQMMNKLADDERMGLNNIVAQAEQGALQFGEPAPEGMAGGGMIAFERGGEVPGYAAGLLVRGLTAAAPYAGRMVGSGLSALRNRTVGPTAASILATPFGFLGGGDEEVAIDEEVANYPDESKRGSASYLKSSRDIVPNLRTQSEAEGRGAAGGASLDKTGIAALGAPTRETDPKKILEAEAKLLKEMGLGEYGGKVKESIEKRRGETKERAEKRLGSETFLAAAEAAGGGGKRMSGLQALAAAVGGAGKAASTIGRERDTALDKITEGEEKLLLAQDLYERGRVGDAQKIGREAQQTIFDNQVKLKTLDLTQQRVNAAIAAAKSKAGGMRIPQTILAKLEERRALLADALSSKQITPQEYQKQMADIEKRISSYIMLGGMQIGTRERDSDED